MSTLHKKAVVILCISMLSVSGLALVPVSADDFEVKWIMDFPRPTYFIGETVTFKVSAFATSDITVFLPGEMAMVTIENESKVEAYSAWVTTGTNGSAIVNWDTGLEISSGNYTIILQPIGGAPITKEISVLYNEETYWKIRVDQLRDELERQYEYLNYLFATSNYLKDQVNKLRSQVVVAGVVMIITILIVLFNVIPDWARRAGASKSKFGFAAGLAKMAGFSNTPKVLQTEQHEELAQLKPNECKSPPRHGLEHYCPSCDKERKEPMTAIALAEHIESYHGNTPGGMPFSRARRREKVYRTLIKEDYKKPVEPKVVAGVQPLEIRRQELIDEALVIEEEREKAAPKKVKKDKKLKLPKVRRRDRPKKEKRQKRRKAQPEKVVLNDSPPPKAESQQKVRRIKQHTGVPSEPVETAEQSSADAIDELYEKLKKEGRDK